MRFVFLVAGAAATGALSTSAITTFAPQTAQTFLAVTALGGDLRNFKVDINPIGKVYQYVMQQVTSGQPGVSWPQGPGLTMQPIDVSKLGFKIDEQEIQRFNAQGMAPTCAILPAGAACRPIEAVTGDYDVKLGWSGRTFIGSPSTTIQALVICFELPSTKDAGTKLCRSPMTAMTLERESRKSISWFGPTGEVKLRQPMLDR
jgi:hypothetical protein